MYIVSKIWLNQNGKAFGDGPYDLLTGIDRLGSLRKAASEMGMSYNQAWHLIQTIEGRLGFSLITRQVGGNSGGGSTVTPKGRLLMERYKAFREESKEVLEQLYEKHFQQMFGT
ncbi:winged helix-turn-helix domain-containing protein [Desulfoscipio gibsoniae]|uniref:Molybdenum-binding protein n=1 Tax=Desulfoscipio gibsoniae DSM 7213 TaxID=767817 RepID=R4KIP0_9FIRM|nr:LysR family transcriptional regulator [Desulfoscipio gibsoniae]AGL00405.1 molybdenum-binding protein [Desulfoscipio gibsoniae DSM 7213]